MKKKLEAHEKKSESGLKALDNKLKNGASKSDLLAQKTLLTGLISDNTKKIDAGIKSLDNKIKNEASKSDLLAQRTFLTGLINKKADLTDFVSVKTLSESNDKAVKALKNIKTTTNTKFAQVEKTIKDNKDSVDQDLARVNTKITSMDAKIKTGTDKPGILDNYKFMIGRNFFTGYDGFQNLLIYPPNLAIY